MHHSIAACFLLAATGSFAFAQASDAADNSISVILQNQGIELGSTTTFSEGVRETKHPVGSSGPFTTVELSLGDEVAQQDLRCQVLDDRNLPIILLRGENNDTTFADGDGGVWDFQDGALFVSTIICDPEFEKREQDLDIRVTLSDGNLATQTVFEVAELSTVILAGVQRRLAKRAASNMPRSHPTLTLGPGVFVDPNLTVISHLIGFVTCITNRVSPNYQ
jgi:hypothetical protein